MPRLNQRLAVLKGVKTKANEQLTELHRVSQKVPLLSGVERTYQPRDDEGDRLPPESQRVQVNLEKLLQDVVKVVEPAMSEQLAIDQANQTARADIEVDGRVLLADVPVTSLMYLEKQCIDLLTLVDKLPTLDPSQIWHQEDTEPGIHRTDPVETTKTKKVPRNHVKAAATDRHPAQVEVYHEDIVVGDWTTIRRSGALPAGRKAELRDRMINLLVAVRHAREQANQVDAPGATVAPLLSYLLRG